MGVNRKLHVVIFCSTSIVVKFCSFRQKVPPDGNKLAGGLSAEPESLKVDAAPKWLNLAFVEAENRSRSLPHN